jgi:DNA-binding beta-propeller fold protein YncE
MIVFNGGNDSSDGNSRVAVAFVVTGHVLFMDASTRTPIECIDTGAQAHAVWPTPDQSQLIVANQNDKKLSRIATDWNADEYELEQAATLDLANGTTPSGAPRQSPGVRPDNAPICPRTDDQGRVTFVTLRGGGMFVVDHHQEPMEIVAEYDKSQVHANGCGGIQAGKEMYINSGAGTLADNPTEHDVYAFDVDGFDSTPNPPNTPAARLIYSYDDRPEADSHGVLLTKHQKYLWVGDRQANTVTAVDTRSNTVAGEFTLEGEASGDPAPDLLDIAPGGEFVFAALRGPNPQSGGHSAFGTTPGVGVIEVGRDGRTGRLAGVARVFNLSARGTEQADPHAIRVRLLGGSQDD